MDKVYLDYSATTPVDSRVVDEMQPYFSNVFGNPSSLHSFGVEAKRAITEARKFLAFFVGCHDREIIFTSGGSESDNLAINGVIDAVGLNWQDEELPHVVTTAFEHKAVLNTIKELEASGKIQATYVRPEEDGVVRSEKILAAIRDNTVLVSVMYVNSEVGTIQPIREIGLGVARVNEARERIGKQRIYFHTDAIQAAEFLQIGPNYLGVDLLTITAHKIYGPKGTGALYVRKGTPIRSQVNGGSQEYGVRAGTENVPGIVGFHAAVVLVAEHRAESRPQKRDEALLCKEIYVDDEALRIAKLRDMLIEGVLRGVSGAYLNGDRTQLAPHIANISFVGVESEAIVYSLDAKGVAVSSGSACTAVEVEPSYVLESMGLPRERTTSGVRFSLGRYTTPAEVKRVMEVLPPVIERLRKQHG
ncbi:MAG: Cysteine desulfurase [bacterium ADurb.Bin400]|nr:MAG: Cysteine desulfurase [bacterium ADurb.Bin400]